MVKKKYPGQRVSAAGIGRPTSAVISGAALPPNKQSGNDGIYINPASGLQLTRAQRRQMKKNTERIDRTVSETDRRFFKRFPHRQFRWRLPWQVELDQLEIISGSRPAPPFGFRFFTLVYKLSSGVRLKPLVPIQVGSVADDVDLPESTLREIWEAVSTPEMRQIEEAMRAKGGAA